MRVAFAGTPAFAAQALHAIAAAGHDIPLVLTQPDRPAGRGLQLQSSPVKQAAQALGLALAQPRSLRLDGRWPDEARAAQAALQQAEPELMVVAAYGLILPGWTLALPARGCLNIHGSVLPRWRGAAPIQRAIEAGDAETGITIMQMDTGLDTGDMLWVEREPIRADDTTSTLHDRLAVLGARLIVDALARLARGERPARPQPAEGVTYAHKIDKSEAPIDWRQDAASLERRIRAFDPFPGATLSWGHETLKVWRAAVVGQAGEPGTVLAAGGGEWVIACGRDALALRELQRPGGRRIDIAAFLASGAASGLAPGLRLPLPVAAGRADSVSR
jgi:methionyl-tRNA formyltransferase